MSPLTELPLRAYAALMAAAEEALDPRSREGQTATEYIMILAGVALAVFLAYRFLGDTIVNWINNVADALGS